MNNSNIDSQEITSLSNVGLPILRLGFRSFFLGAGIFSILAMAIWMANYVFAIPLTFTYMSPTLWHAHEMIFGYLVAVVAGFLLTAIKSWTGLEVLRGFALGLLFLLWLVARILPFLNIAPLWLVALVDVSFLFFLTIICLRPVWKVKQYRQFGLLSKLWLLMTCHIVFYLGLGGLLEQGTQWGLHSAVYMLIALVLVMMRRVMPMFIKGGIQPSNFQAKNRAWLDHSSLILLVCLWIADVFTNYYIFSGIAACLLAILHSIRLAGWTTNKIWSKPLVWVLVVSYLGLIIGFGLQALSTFTNLPPNLALHAFTVGGLAMVTLGMMSRVTLGHTGRSVFNPPKAVFWSFLLLVLGFIVRVIFPLFSTSFYSSWVGLSMAFWMLSFGVFVAIYSPMLLSARIDGKDG